MGVAGGIFSSKLINVHARLFGTLEYFYSKTKMGMAGVIFEPHPPNFENLYNF